MNIIKHVNNSAMNACRGIAVTFKNEKMFRFHLSLYILVLILMRILAFDTAVQLTLFTFMIMTLSSELLNTAIEDVVDLVVDEQFHTLAKRAKDAAGGGVLICALSGYAVFLYHAFLFIIT